MKTCQQPDKHCAALLCGHPLPCPHHTCTIDIDAGAVTVPYAAGRDDPNGVALKLVEVAEALADD